MARGRQTRRGTGRAALLGTFLAWAAVPGAAHAAGYVRSVEYVEITLASGVTSASVNLNKGQSYLNCVPFASAMVSGANSAYGSVFTDVYLQGSPARVTAQRSGSTGIVRVGVFVVEFDPAYVGVQQGTFSIANGAMAPGSAPTISSVTLAKAALVFYYRNGSASTARSDFAVAGRFASATQLGFQRDGTSGAISGHYYVLHALGSEFSVLTVPLSIAGGSSSNTAAIAPVDLTKSFVVASYRTAYAGADPEDGQIGVYLSGPTALTADRQFRTGGGNAISDIQAFVIQLSGDARVQRGSLSYADTEAQKAAVISAVNLPFAMAWNGVTTGPGPIQSEANAPADTDSGFQRLRLAGAGTVQGDRSVGACATDCNGVGRFEVVEWETSPPEPVCGGPNGSWWDEGWGRRRKITFDNSGQAENLQGFPLLVKLDSSRIDYALTQNAGQDLRFVDSDDQAVLAHEIERWSVGGTSYVWVRVPQIDGSSRRDSIWMYYDNAGALDGQSISAVWDGGFKMVQHLDESAGPHLDSTAYGNHSVAIDVAAQGTAGHVAGADLLSRASQDNVDVADSPSLDVGASESLTVEAWVKTTLSTNWQMVVDKKNAQGSRFWQVWVDFGNPSFSVGDGPNAPDRIWAISNTPVADGAWHYLVGRWDRGTSTGKIFIDGVNAPPDTDTNTTIGAFENSSPVMIGQEGDLDGGGNFDGAIDEVRVSKVSRSDDWIRAQYLSMRDTFAMYGPELGACNLRSIGSGPAYGTGQAPAQGGGTTVSVKAGSRRVVGGGAPGPAWKTANRGRGDSIDIAGFKYTILAVDSETELRLTVPYNGADASGLTYTIDRKFDTIDDWRACIDTSAGCGVDPAVPSTNLVADGRGEVGILYKDSIFTGFGDGNGEITGIGGGHSQYKALTTDPGHFVTLTADGPNRHYGVAGSGVVIDGLDDPNKAGMIRVVANYTRIEWVEIRNVCPTQGCSSTAAIKIDGSAAGIVIDRVLLHDNINGIIWSSPATTSVTIRNSIIYASTGHGVWPQNATDTVTIDNCTIVGKSGGGRGINKFSNPAITATNTIALHNPGGDFVSGISQSNNISSDTSASGTGSLQNRVATNTAGATANRVVFVACPPAVSASCTSGAGTYDLHLQSSTVNDAVNTGADLSDRFVEDVDGQGRPVGAATWDVGADERPGQADLTISKTDGRTSAVPGTPITYTLRVTNNGPSTVTNLVVTDTVPSDILSPTFTPSEGSYHPASGLWTGVSLPPNDFVVLTLSGTIKPSAIGTLDNIATVAAGTGYADTTPGNNTGQDNDTSLTPEADLSIVKSAPAGPFSVGTDFTYTVTVTNNGPSDATGVVVTDPLPFEVEFLSSTPSNPPCAFDPLAHTLTCTPSGSLAPSATFVVTIDVKAVAAGSIVNAVSVGGSRPDRVPTNNADEAQTDVFAPGTAVRFFSSTSTDGKVVLQWLNPDIVGPPDYSQTEIYVRTDHFTTIPTELGNQQVCAQSDENDKDSCTHNPGGAGNGTTYYYSAFVRMADSSLSAPRFVKGRPFLTTGRARFAYGTGAASMAAPGVGVEAIHAVSNDNALHSVWKATHPSEVGEWPTDWKPLAMMGPSQGRPTTIPIAIGTHARIVYLGSQDGRVYAIDADKGEQVWSTSLAALWQPGTMVQAQPSGMFLGFGGTHDYILVGTRYTGGDNAFYALDRDDGDPVAGWPFSDGGADGKIGIVSNQATVDYATRRVYLTSFARSATDNRTVWCLNLDTGAKVWAKPYPSVTTSPTLRGSKLYVGTADGDVLALEAANPPTYGNVVWSFATGDGPVKGFIMADRFGPAQDLYFSTSNRVWALTDTGASGTEKWGGSPLGSRSLPGPSTPILWQGRLHVGGSDGKLYTLRALDGSDDLPPLALGDGSAGIGSPTLDINDNHLYVGSEAGVIHAVLMP
jgi:uncharacterized repeat protein (TIGR01451 family)